LTSVNWLAEPAYNRPTFVIIWLTYYTSIHVFSSHAYLTFFLLHANFTSAIPTCFPKEFNNTKKKQEQMNSMGMTIFFN